MMIGEMATALIGAAIGHLEGEAMKGEDLRALFAERELVLIMAVAVASVLVERGGVQIMAVGIAGVPSGRKGLILIMAAAVVATVLGERGLVLIMSVNPAQEKGGLLLIMVVAAQALQER